MIGKNIIVLFTIFAAGSFAIAQEVDLTYLRTVPARKAILSRKFSRDPLDSTPDFAEKQEKYYQGLRKIGLDLIRLYFPHGEFPADPLKCVEDLAVTKAGIRYPLSPTTGCSAYVELVQQFKIREIDKLIGEMGPEIFSGAKNIFDANVGSKEALMWRENWNKAGLRKPVLKPIHE